MSSGGRLSCGAAVSFANSAPTRELGPSALAASRCNSFAVSLKIAATMPAQQAPFARQVGWRMGRAQLAPEEAGRGGCARRIHEPQRKLASASLRAAATRSIIKMIDRDNVCAHSLRDYAGRVGIHLTLSRPAAAVAAEEKMRRAALKWRAGKFFLGLTPTIVGGRLCQLAASWLRRLDFWAAGAPRFRAAADRVD